MHVQQLKHWRFAQTITWVDIAIKSTIWWPSSLLSIYLMSNNWHPRLHWSRFRKLLGNNHKVILTRSKFDNSTEPYSFKPIPTEDIRPAFFSLIADRSVETAWDVAVCWFVERFNKEWELPFDTPVSDLHMKHKAHPYIINTVESQLLFSQKNIQKQTRDTVAK